MGYFPCSRRERPFLGRLGDEPTKEALPAGTRLETVRLGRYHAPYGEYRHLVSIRGGTYSQATEGSRRSCMDNERGS